MTNDPKNAALDQAIRDFLTALGQPVTGELAETPERVTDLWQNHLLKGYRFDFANFASRTSPTDSTSPVVLTDIGVHLVCPHHLTIAFGKAHLAYQPNGKIAGLGALSDLVGGCTARLVLQEDATNHVANALVESIGATAAVVLLDATHPCHNVLHPRSHDSRTITSGKSGNPNSWDELTALLHQAINQTT